MGQSDTRNKYADAYSEEIIVSAIRRAIPRWGQGWFDVCPVNQAARFFGIKEGQENDAFRLLNLYHCVDKEHIPAEISKRIPELIREALEHAAPEPEGGSTK